jgi:hypothetical protein
MRGHVLEGKKRALAVLAQVDAAAAAKRDPAA